MRAKRAIKSLYYRLLEDDGGEGIETATIIILVIALVIGMITFSHGYNEAVKVKPEMGRVAYQSERVRMVAPVMAVMDDGKIIKVEGRR